MILDAGALAQLAQHCAPTVAPATLLAVAKTESNFDPWVVAVNGPARRVYHPSSASAAANLARLLLARGQNLDLGLAQINSRNLARLGLAPESAFDPCQNLAASARLLQSDYARARSWSPDAQGALQIALSRYNTGDDRKGVQNGYVARVGRAAEGLVPALSTAAPSLAVAPSEPKRPPSWDVFASASSPLVF